MPVVAFLFALSSTGAAQPLGHCAQARLGAAQQVVVAASPLADCPHRSRQSAKPKGSPTRWFTLNDYPARALREERQGTVKFSLKVGRDGRPTRCDITSSSGHDVLDQYTCNLLMRRARFCPATDRKSHPIDGEWSGGVTWAIPEE